MSAINDVPHSVSTAVTVALTPIPQLLVHFSSMLVQILFEMNTYQKRNAKPRATQKKRETTTNETNEPNQALKVSDIYQFPP